ncbi:MAG: DNA repair protein RecN [Alphaproteobacteria bacterium]|nr:DNA repair protein RecN [Alphaproteobacteria bacterium]
MLISLSVRNLVLIDRLELDFQAGLSVLTGETGAGKSILLDALGLVLGNRAESSLIRHGEEKLGVAADFLIKDKSHPVFELLKEFEIEAEDEICIKRVLDTNGKGKIFINDQPITAKLLKEIGKLLVEVHGQFDNQGLLNPANHLDVLDAYGNYPTLLEEVKNNYHALLQARKVRKTAEEMLEKAKTDEENLKHWVDELEKLKITEDEEERLSKRRLELMNAEKLMESLNYAFGALTQGSDVQSALRSAQSALEKANHLTDGKYDEIVEMLDQALIQTSEAVNSIETAAENISMNNNELENIEERLFTLKAIARKHGVSIAELPKTLEKFQTELNSIVLGVDNINKLRQAEEQAKLDYVKAAKKLSEQRMLTAKKLDENVMKELPPLKMEKAKFVTQVSKVDETAWKADGADDVSFTVATNPNSPQGPINKIASGGELARFMLALKLNLAQSSSVETMIFDEVDAGIGGATAEAVGERLARLAKDVQVLVVTHSPQVASKGNNHFKVEKSTQNNITTTKVAELSIPQRLEEIARMLSGENITDEARAAAKVLINQ